MLLINKKNLNQGNNLRTRSRVLPNKLSINVIVIVVICFFVYLLTK